MAALALSGDWAAEFHSGSDSGGLLNLGDTADADWTKEFIAVAGGSLTLFIISYVTIKTSLKMNYDA